MMLTSGSAKDFSSARQRAFVEDWLSFLQGRSNQLLSFTEVREALRLKDSTYKGLQDIELDKIVGSTGRYHEFTRTFLPKKDEIEQRWRRVDAVAHEQGYPPIEVFKVGEVYFVRDGNHRISVARTHNAITIEAYVVEYRTPIPIESEDDLDDILLKMERTEFLSRTNLDAVRPGHNVIFTEVGRYPLVLEHIEFHKYVRELDLKAELTYEQAVESWHDNVYLPVINLIRERDMLENFPQRTEADLYGWLLLHRAELERQFEALGYVSDVDLLTSMVHENSYLARVVNLFRSPLELADLPLKIERARFLQATQLERLRPNNAIKCTEPGCYQLMLEHIKVHKYLKETAQGLEISYEEAVTSWYDNVYLPTIELIIARRFMHEFPGNTLSDLYIWLISRRAALEREKDILGEVSSEAVLDQIEAELSRPIRRLTHFLRHKLIRQSVLENS